LSTSGIRIESTGFFEQKTDADLLACYNEVLGTMETKLPGTRAFTVERILKVLAAKRPQKFDKPVKPKRDRKPKRPGFPGRVHAPFDYKPRPGPRVCWKNSIRWRVLQACLKGATLDQLKLITGTDSPKRNYNYVRQLHTEMGWGIKEIDGVITVYDS